MRILPIPLMKKRPGESVELALVLVPDVDQVHLLMMVMTTAPDTQVTAEKGHWPIHWEEMEGP